VKRVAIGAKMKEEAMVDNRSIDQNCRIFPLMYKKSTSLSIVITS
jgi:hypothetical protein